MKYYATIMRLKETVELRIPFSVIFSSLLVRDDVLIALSAIVMHIVALHGNLKSHYVVNRDLLTTMI